MKAESRPAAAPTAGCYLCGRSVNNRAEAVLTDLDVPQPLWLGRHHANGYVDREDIYFQGDIDELTFYRRALTEKEIRSIYRAGAHGKCPSAGS